MDASNQQFSPDALVEQLLRLQNELRAFRRRTQELLNNLEEENMPAVSEKLTALTTGLSLLLTSDTEPSVNGDALVRAINLASTALSLDGAVAPTLYKNAGTRKSGTHLLALDKDGRLCAVTE